MRRGTRDYCEGRSKTQCRYRQPLKYLRRIIQESANRTENMREIHSVFFFYVFISKLRNDIEYWRALLATFASNMS